MKKGNLRTKKIYPEKGIFQFVIEARTFGGTWRYLSQDGVLLVFDTEPEAIKKLLSFFEPRPLTLRTDNEDRGNGYHERD